MTTCYLVEQQGVKQLSAISFQRSVFRCAETGLCFEKIGFSLRLLPRKVNQTRVYTQLFILN